MKAYVVATVHVADPETYKKYADRTPAIVARHGGKFLARGGEARAIEGEAFNDRMVIIEFPSQQALQAWYDDPDYQEAKVFRHAASEGRFITVAGVAD